MGKEGDKQWQEGAHFLECIKSDPKSGCSIFHCGFSMDISLNFWDLKTVTGKAFEFYFINYLLYGSRKLSFYSDFLTYSRGSENRTLLKF